MAPKRVLVDTNVVLDWLIDRKPWADEASALWDSQGAGTAELCIAASVLDTIFYIIRKGKSAEIAKRAIEQCVNTLTVLPVEAAIIRLALAQPGADFEDNILVACAVLNAVDLIATRDADGYKQSPVPAVDPKDVTAHLPSA